MGTAKGKKGIIIALQYYSHLKLKKMKNTTPHKPATKVGKGLQKLDTAKAIKAVKEAKEVKYIYPVEITDPLQRKQFRRRARTASANYEAQIKALKKSNKAEDKKELEKVNKDFTKFTKATYIPGV